jgi:hypothetical protein
MRAATAKATRILVQVRGAHKLVHGIKYLFLRDIQETTPKF